MEGLIPMVYRKIKKNRTRKQYRCLSNGPAETYNIADFYPSNDHYSYDDFTINPSSEKVSSFNLEENGLHRRHKSVHVVDYSNSFGTEENSPKPNKQQLVRFRSHRFLSCVTGA